MKLLWEFVIQLRCCQWIIFVNGTGLMAGFTHLWVVLEDSLHNLYLQLVFEMKATNKMIDSVTTILEENLELGDWSSLL